MGVNNNNNNNNNNNHKSSRGGKQKARPKRTQEATSTSSSSSTNDDEIMKEFRIKTTNITTILGIGVAIMAIALSWFFSTGGNESLQNNDDARTTVHVTEFLNSFVCNHHEGYCATNNVNNGMSLLEPIGRTHRATQSIAPKTVLMKIPQSLQISDIDAVRALFPKNTESTRIQRFKHFMTGKPLDGGAYLALYLWQRFVVKNDDNDPLLPYYKVLNSSTTTTSINANNHHILLWSNEEFQALLPPHSQVHAIARAYRDMVHSEYKAFVTSTSYQNLNRTDYIRFRLLVLTRSFGSTDTAAVSQLLTKEEVQYYNTTLGIDFTLGSRAMVPVLDMYDHHATPNVEWRYHTEDGSIVVTSSSSSSIEKGQIIYDSYGTYTDAHLLAKFGFVATDGSSHTEASMAAFHRLLNVGLRQQFDYISSSPQKYKQLVEQQKFLLARYLQFDDGHDECIVRRGDADTTETTSKQQQQQSKEYRLKQLKLQHLMRCAHDPKRWILTVPPRNPTAKPPTNTANTANTVPSFQDDKPPHVDASKALATCRLMVLTLKDYNGDALHVLESHLVTNHENDKAIWVEQQSDTLEYHALICLARWTGLLLRQFNIPDLSIFQSNIMNMEQTSSKDGNHHHHAITASHAILGEVQTLQLLTQLASSGARQRLSMIMEKKNTNNDDNDDDNAVVVVPNTRRLPCDWNYTKALAEETKFV